MAYYAALTSLLRTIEEIPQPVKQITSLQMKINRLLVILKDCSQKNNLTNKDLEGKITDVSYEAEDIIESYISRQALSKSVSFGVSSRSLKMIRALQRPVKYMHQYMGMKSNGLGKIIDEFDGILDELSNKIKDGRVEDVQLRDSLNVGSSRFVANDASALVGLDETLIQMKDRLTGSPSRLDIITIVGMGGIGKTTLARNLYNDLLIEQHFDTRGWIVVSQEYDVKKMLMGLLNSTIHCSDELHQKNIGDLAEQLYKSLKGRRYLIVMDDVWDTKAWDEVRRFFPDDNNGSRVILTTRLSEVATYANSCNSIHHMNLLSLEASWDLLREKVFGKERCPFALEKVGKKIAKNCEGLPLAIIVVGGILSKGSKTRDYWEYIAENVKSAVAGNNDQFMEILSLSYNSLPHHLKACFLYMGVFPEDSVVFISRLIMLWIAEGFVEPQAGKCLEEVAEDYLKDLIDRNLIMVHKRNHNGGIKTCIIHDLLRELCVEKAKDGKLLQIMNWNECVFPRGRNDQRRLSIHSNIIYRLGDIHDSPTRSLLYFWGSSSDYQIVPFTVSCRLLRVLNALNIWFGQFPVEIFELVHLRYVALTYWGNNFPASLSKLRNLQTLIFYKVGFSPFQENLYLPSSIWEMPQLRHLLIKGIFLPHPFSPEIMGQDPIVLKNLQTLSNVMNFSCTRKVLDFMPNLKKLGVSYFRDKDNEWLSYEFHNFVHLQHLETLKCHFIAPYLLCPVNFAFPPSLRNLTLSGCRISWEKMTVVGSLPNLEVLKLKDRAFEGSVWEPNEGEFSKLKFLLIHTSFLEDWRANDTHFPRLQHLSLICCSNLVEIPLDIGDIPTLEIIELCECSPSAVDSAMLIQEEQQSLENNTLRVRVINYYRDYYYSRQNKSLQKEFL